MKAFKTVAKIFVALAAVAGAVYVVATYGDKIVAWCKDMLNRLPCCKGDCDCDCECTCECACECAEEEACEPAVEEAAAEEAPVEDAPVAEETDFEG